MAVNDTLGASPINDPDSCDCPFAADDESRDVARATRHTRHTRHMRQMRWRRRGEEARGEKRPDLMVRWGTRLLILQMAVVLSLLVDIAVLLTTDALNHDGVQVTILGVQATILGVQATILGVQATILGVQVTPRPPSRLERADEHLPVDMSMRTDED